MELLVFLFGLLSVCFGIWFFVSPFIVLSLSSRITALEAQLAQLQKSERKRKASESLSRYEPAELTAQQERDDSYQLSAVEPSTHQVELKPRREPTPEQQLGQEEIALPEPADEIGTYALANSVHSDPDSLSARNAVDDSSVKNADVRTSTGDTDPRGLHLENERPEKSTLPEAEEPSSLEELLAGKWLSWVGALAVIIGFGFGFKYAVENNWIGPRERVSLGLFTGLCCFWGGAFAIRRKYVFLSQSLTGAGLGILYLSLYAAFGWYGILSYEAAFLGMAATTVLGLAFAGYFNLQPTAFLGMLGGFLTPAMLWPEHDPMWSLFPYLLMLDLGVLLIAGVRRWAALEVLSFCGTLWIWFSWHQSFFHPHLLVPTISFLTAFLILFALLSIWHNVIRKRAALAADFFLILITPVAYFAALYGLTFEILPQWQAEFSLCMMLFYGLLASLARIWHPDGKSIIAALAGLSATFLILAPPLELTGHWVTICWIAQAVLLVELGLYFRERSLLWTGLALLAKVQLILLIYFVGTLADPVHFQTAFVRIQLHLIGRPVTPNSFAEGLFSLINGRSLSYLADVIGFAILAWELGRKRREPRFIESLLPSHNACQVWLNLTVPLAALAIIVLETYVWGRVWNWDAATIVSVWIMWTALFAGGLILWSRIFVTRGIEALGMALFLLLACFIAFDTVEALTVAALGPNIPLHRIEAWWLLNPRGVSFLFVVLAGAFVSLLYSNSPEASDQSSLVESQFTAQDFTRFFGILAFALGLGLVLLETRVWGAHHNWLPTTTLSACACGAALFLIGGTVWHVTRRIPWTGSLVSGTFILLQALLILSTLISVGEIQQTVHQPEHISPVDWWLVNPRGIGYLASLGGCTLAAYLCWRNGVQRKQTSLRISQLPEMLGLGAYLTGLVAVLLETWSWGVLHGWYQGTLYSAGNFWLSLFVTGLVGWSVRFRTKQFDPIVIGEFVLILILLLADTLGTVNSLSDQHVSAPSAYRAVIEEWFLNPRCFGFLCAILATVACGWMANGTGRHVTIPYDDRPDSPQLNLDTTSLSGIAVYLGGVILLTLEFYTQGTSRDWHTSTSLAITLAWTIYATLMLIIGIAARSGWLRVFSLGLFILTVIKVFLFDVWHLETVIRFVAFLSLGVALLVVSFLYRRFRERIRSWMVPELNLKSR